jgi:hypothetical protein
MHCIATLLLTASIHSAPLAETYNLEKACAEKTAILRDMAEVQDMWKSLLHIEKRYSFRLTDDVPRGYQEELIGCIKRFEFLYRGYRLEEIEVEGGHKKYILERR